MKTDRWQSQWQSRWYVRRQADGQSFGPYTTAQIGEYLGEGLLAEDDLARSDDGRVVRVGELVGERGSRPAAPPTAPPTAPPASSARVARAARPSDRPLNPAPWGPWSRAAVACAVAGLLFCPLVFGLIGIGLGVVGITHGEERGGFAVGLAALLTAASMAIAFVVLSLGGV